MNKKNFYLLALILVTFSFSCQYIFKNMLGIEDPKIETKESLINFLNNFDLDSIPEIYSFKDSFSYYQAMQEISLPDAIFYSKNNFLVNYKEKPNDCNGKVDSIMVNVDDINYMPFNNEKLVNYYIDNIVKIDYPLEKIFLNKNYDGYVFVFWSKFMGKHLFKKRVVDWINNYYKNNSNMKLFFINLDLHEFWYEKGNKTKK